MQVDLATKLTQDAEEALHELKVTVEQSSAQLVGISPFSPEALKADKAVAKAAKKAADLTKVLNEYRARGQVANVRQR